MSPLATLEFLTVIIVSVLIMTKKTSPPVTLVVVPVVTGITSCFFIVVAPKGAVEGTQGMVGLVANFKSLGSTVTGFKGIGSAAVTSVMFIFSIPFLDILTDAGTFRPTIKGILNPVGTNSVKIGIGTAILAATIRLDSPGAVILLICVFTLPPLYDALGMCRITLATIVALSAGTMNILPQDGPTIRVVTALSMSDNPVTFFLLVPPAVLVGLVCVLVISAFLGAGEKKRIGAVALQAAGNTEQGLTEEQKALLRPHLFRVNTILIAAAIVSLLFSGFTPAMMFMASYVLAAIISYPSVRDSKVQVNIHTKEVLTMCFVLLAAGCSTGIMQGTGIITEMVSTLVSIIPHMMGKFFPFTIGIIGMPASLLFDPDSFYYGVLPAPARTAEGFGVAGVDAGRATILGQMTISLPVSPLIVSTSLLMGLSGVDFGEHQKKTIPLAWLVSLVIVVVAILTRGIAT